MYCLCQHCHKTDGIIYTYISLTSPPTHTHTHTHTHDMYTDHPAISKDDFLSTVDLISSTLVTSGSYSPISGQLCQTVFSSSEREKLYSLPDKLRRTRLQELMGMISDHEAGTTTDEDALKGAMDLVNNHSPSPPPLPPRTMSTSSMNPEDLKTAEELLSEEHGTNGGAAKSNLFVNLKKPKPQILPRKASQLKKTLSSTLDTAPAVDRSLKPNTPKLLKSPRRKRHHMNSTLRQMYSLDAPGKANVFSSLQSTTISEYVLDDGDGDSDSNSSDFEDFIPPQRRHFVSECQEPMSVHTSIGPRFHAPLDRRGSSPFPSTISSRPNSKEITAIRKSSPILTRRPTWYTRKMTSPALLETSESPTAHDNLPNPETVEKRGQDQQSKSLRKKKARSRSLDSRTNLSVSGSGNAYSLFDLHAVAVDSDENTGGTVDSSGYARPFEHINSWRKLIGMDDGSAFSGSLPHLADNVSTSINNNDEDSDTYLDPKEIAQKLDKNMPEKVRKRLDTVFSNTYLQLISVQPPRFAEVDSTTTVTSPKVIAATPVEPSDPQLPSREASFKDKWNNRSLDFIERPDSCLSGYTSEGSSIWTADRSDQETEEGELDDGTVNPYDEIKAANVSAAMTASPFDDTKYGSCAPVEVGGEELYSVIDEVLVDRKGTNVSMRVKRKISSSSIPPLPKPRVKKEHTPLSKQDSGIYAKLEETINDVPLEVVKDECSDCPRPPTPPPRPQKQRNISTVSKVPDGEEGQNSYKHLDIPGVSVSE